MDYVLSLALLRWEVISNKTRPRPAQTDIVGSVRWRRNYNCYFRVFFLVFHKNLAVVLQIALMGQVERMRQAILEGNEMAFARPPPPRPLPFPFPQPGPYPLGIGGFPFVPQIPPDSIRRGMPVRGRGMIGE